MKLTSFDIKIAFMLWVLSLAFLFICAASATAIDHTIGRSQCQNPSCTCGPACQCDPCDCGVAQPVITPVKTQAIRGKARSSSLEGQRFIIAVDQPENSEQYLRELARDNGYRFWERQSCEGMPPGVYEAEVVDGTIYFAEPRLTARPRAAAPVSQVAYQTQPAVQPSFNGATYRAVGQPAAPPGYVCDQYGCRRVGADPNNLPWSPPLQVQPTPATWWTSDYTNDAGGGCADGSCGAAQSYSGGGRMFSGFFSGGSSGCQSCGS
jgi:hypothetical protein